MKTVKKIAARIKGWDRGTLVIGTGLTLGMDMILLVLISQMRGFDFWQAGPLGLWFGVLGGCIGIASGQWMARLGSFPGIEGRGATLLGPVQGVSFALSLAGSFNFVITKAQLGWTLVSINDFPLAAIVAAVVGLMAAPVAQTLGTIYSEPEPERIPRQPSTRPRR